MEVEEIDLNIIKQISEARYDEKRQLQIIMGLDSDDKKIYAMKLFVRSSSERVKIVNSLVSVDKRIQCLDLFETVQEQNAILKELRGLNDQQKYIVVSKIASAIEKKKIILSMDSDDVKIKALQFCPTNVIKKEIILTLSERNRIRQVTKVFSLAFQREIIYSIEDDDIKKEEFEQVSDENVKTLILCSLLDDDEYKIEKIGSLKDETNIARVISSFLEDETKVRYMNQLEDERKRAIVIMSLLERENIVQQLKLGKTEKRLQIDPEITIGIEIEAEGELYQYIQEIGLLLFEDYEEASEEVRCWGIKADNSLEKGIEIVSPILTDNEKDIEDIRIVCELMKKMGLSISERCGGHIHLGADYLKTVEEYKTFFSIYGNCEKILYKIANKKGSIPRGAISQYAKTISPELSRELENENLDMNSIEELNEFIQGIQEIQQDRRYGLNCLNINMQKNTIEFRIANGTIDFDTWMENIKLFARILQKSKEIAQLESLEELDEQGKKIILLKDMLVEEIPEKDKLEILLEILFEEDEKEEYRQRYIVNSELIENLDEKDKVISDKDFAKVEFKKKHNIHEFEALSKKMNKDRITEVMRQLLNESKKKDEKDEGVELR